MFEISIRRFDAAQNFGGNPGPSRRAMDAGDPPPMCFGPWRSDTLDRNQVLPQA
jgi:hypothetical protein